MRGVLLDISVASGWASSGHRVHGTRLSTSFASLSLVARGVGQSQILLSIVFIIFLLFIVSQAHLAKPNIDLNAHKLIQKKIKTMSKKKCIYRHTFYYAMRHTQNRDRVRQVRLISPSPPYPTTGIGDEGLAGVRVLVLGDLLDGGSI